MGFSGPAAYSAQQHGQEVFQTRGIGKVIPLKPTLSLASLLLAGVVGAK